MHYIIIIIVLFLVMMWYVQKTSKNCNYVFKVPESNVVKNWINPQPVLTKSENMANKNSDLDPLNDRINTHYMGNPYFIKKENMGDITKGYWLSNGSEAKKNNSGRVTTDNHMASDLITPDFRNEIASKTRGLVYDMANKSRMENMEVDGPNQSHPWSKSKY